jgi:hypothetical protein
MVSAPEFLIATSWAVKSVAAPGYDWSVAISTPCSLARLSTIFAPSDP